MGVTPKCLLSYKDVDSLFFSFSPPPPHPYALTLCARSFRRSRYLRWKKEVGKYHVFLLFSFCNLLYTIEEFYSLENQFGFVFANAWEFHTSLRVQLMNCSLITSVCTNLCPVYNNKNHIISIPLTMQANIKKSKLFPCFDMSLKEINDCKHNSTHHRDHIWQEYAASIPLWFYGTIWFWRLAALGKTGQI